MQLWKKNFLFMFFLIQGLLFLGLFAFVSYSFQQSLIEETEEFKQMMTDNQFLINKIVEEPTSTTSRLAKDLAELMGKQRQFYIEIILEEEQVFSSVPNGLSIERKLIVNQMTLHKSEQLLTYQTEQPAENGIIRLFFIKDSSEIYQKQQQRIFSSVLFGLFFSSIISFIMYRQMKKIYRPIENLSHELRTPLTLISGFSEFLVRMRTTEEEKIVMAQEIFDEALRLQTVVEQLLIMGDLKDGEITKEKLYLSSIIQLLESKYSILTVSVISEKEILGNKVLLLSLLENLLDNAFRASGEVRVSLTGSSLVISNEGRIPEKQIRKMNRGKKLLPGEYDGAGQGYLICREIVSVHNGKIKLTAEENEIKVSIDFP